MNNGYQKLINDLISLGYLKTPRIIKAFRKFERKYFVPKSLSSMANLNRPLPIGSGQTISQPLTVAFMLELLQPRKGNIILEIGGGSGWQTAILSHVVGKSGYIYAFEIVKKLAEFGKKNTKRFNLLNVTFMQKDVSSGYPQHAPYDRIISGAAFEKIPDTLKNQLAIKGVLVAPTKEQDIRRITRVSKSNFKTELYPGFVFVPITSKKLHNYFNEH